MMVKFTKLKERNNTRKIEKVQKRVQNKGDKHLNSKEEDLNGNESGNLEPY